MRALMQAQMLLLNLHELHLQGCERRPPQLSPSLPHVLTHLVVAAAPRVQLAAHCADQLAEAPLVSGVDVFIPTLDSKGACVPLGSHPAGKAGRGRLGQQQCSCSSGAAVDPATSAGNLPAAWPAPRSAQLRT